MKKFLLLAIFLLIAVWAAWYFPAPGYVLVSYQTWSIEVTLGVALLGLLLCYMLLGILLRILRGTAAFPGRMRRWYCDRHLRKAREDLHLGMSALIEERWAEAEKRFMRHADKGDMPVFHYIGAAKAANRQGAFERRDAYLGKARVADEKLFSFPIDIMQARLQLGANQFRESLSTLKQLQDMMPNHPSVLRMMVEIHQHFDDCEALQQLLPQLRARNVFTNAQMDDLTRDIYQGLLKKAQAGEAAASLDATWEAVPRQLKTDIDLVTCYAECLIQRGSLDKAAQLLNKMLKKQKDPEARQALENLLNTL